jgi:hypothetical protein
MKGIQYKGTFASKGSQLYEALTEGRMEEALKVYADTTARNHATLNKLSVPRVVIPDEKKPLQWKIVAEDAEYDKQGKFVRRLEKGGYVDVKI